MSTAAPTRPSWWRRPAARWLAVAVQPVTGNVTPASRRGADRAGAA